MYNIFDCDLIWPCGDLIVTPSITSDITYHHCDNRLKHHLVRRWRAIHGHWTNAGLMLGQRRRRWPNIKTTLFQRLVFAGLWAKRTNLWPNEADMTFNPRWPSHVDSWQTVPVRLCHRYTCFNSWSGVTTFLLCHRVIMLLTCRYYTMLLMYHTVHT